MKMMNGNFEQDIEPTIDELGAMEEELKSEDITEPSADELVKCDGIQIYLNEAKKIPLLTAGEELVLGKLIREGGSEAAAAKERLIKSNLLRQLTSPVKWTQSVQNMIADGATSFTEVGPGAVLQGMIKKINKEWCKEHEVSGAAL